MKKLLLGAALGIAAGAVGYKLYKENEEEIKGFIDERLSDYDDVDVEDIDLEDLEDLRDCIDDMIDAKLKGGFQYDDISSCDDEDCCCSDDCSCEEEKNYDDDYICIVHNSEEEKEDSEANKEK